MAKEKSLEEEKPRQRRWDAGCFAGPRGADTTVVLKSTW